MLRTNPIATADRPTYEFKHEMTVGIYAPPIGMMNSNPNSTASPTTPENAWADHGAVGFTTTATPSAAAITRTPILTTFCPGYVTGRWGIHLTSCSLPAAIKLPVKVRNPRMTSATMALMRNAVSSAGCSVRPRKYSAVPTRPAASPPNAWDSAVR